MAGVGRVLERRRRRLGAGQARTHAASVAGFTLDAENGLIVAEADDKEPLRWELDQSLWKSRQRGCIDTIGIRFSQTGGSMMTTFSCSRLARW